MSELTVQSHLAAVDPSNLDTVKLEESRPTLAVQSFGLTDPGKVRSSNQDQFLIASLCKALHVHNTSVPQPKVQQSRDRSYLFLVADGMGGRAGGEEASALAVSSVECFVLETFKWFARCKGREHDKVLADFQSALGQANANLLAEAQAHPELQEMGTTLTLAYSLNENLFVAHAGDSRCYILRDGELYRLTSDHTLVDEMVRQGVLEPEEAANHRWRHVITNAIGAGSSEVKVEVHKLRLEAGDVVLLCSDGLTNMIADEEIAQTLQEETDPEQACQKLITRANEEGGDDNITVVIARYAIARTDAHDDIEEVAAAPCWKRLFYSRREFAGEG